MLTYLFYDVETTGLNKAFDQVLHFAAIRTDLNLVELERHDIKIKLNPDIIPSPKAMITHHIGIQESQQGLPEVEAIKQIHQLLNTPGTISLGYNTLGFDDEFLRFSFHRNLLPPYTHQYANQCGRMDIYPIAIMYFLYQNQVINWPKKEGKTSLKLENINADNQFFNGRSHHAMVDVEVTLALAKKFFQERKTWDYLTEYFNKPIDEKRSKNLTTLTGLMISGKAGAKNAYQCPVFYLGNHRHYKNQTLWLRLDLENLATTTMESIAETTWVIRKKLAEPGFIMPFDQKYLTHLSAERLSVVTANQQWLAKNSELLQHIIQYHAEYKYPIYPDTDAEASLYLTGFLTFDEEQFCRKFHKASPPEKARITENLRSSKLKTLATRVLGRHYFDSLSDQEKEEFTHHMQKIKHGMIDYKGQSRLTPEVALKEIDELRMQPELTVIQHDLLNELESYLKQRFLKP